MKMVSESTGDGDASVSETTATHSAESDRAASRDDLLTHPNATKPRGSALRRVGDLDMTPMVDVTFLLLIFFMVTASFSMQKSIQIPRQTSDDASHRPIDDVLPDLPSVEVQINKDGGFLVLGIAWQREVLGKQSLLATLDEIMQTAPQPMRLNVKVHEAAKLQYLVDCLDAGSIVGFAETQITVEETLD
ncbi:ExbD/TolR family protein [Rhodopirellula sp. SWK7]|uniref:ExbD/TolR family protein n=1 Tax=Rhodopirellula sp. SWK7 TaxID=595460 RepID=UPI0002C03794|nr:biopolymer transporter ExbD [Rhodopirellula sp. SWK7]EMI41514.1 Biopolymer transport protein ExbD/TolR [Rhodopirellula sp. SWK7]